VFDFFAAHLLGNLHLAQRQHRVFVSPPERQQQNLATRSDLPKPTSKAPPVKVLPAEAFPGQSA
jgi:hypothetical protein